jgi:hypothetical protein
MVGYYLGWAFCFASTGVCVTALRLRVSLQWRPFDHEMIQMFIGAIFGGLAGAAGAFLLRRRSEPHLSLAQVCAVLFAIASFALGYGLVKGADGQMFVLIPQGVLVVTSLAGMIGGMCGYCLNRPTRRLAR